MRKIFEGLFGNEAAKMRFSSAILAGTLPHAFLISGPEGSGKLTLATEICAALNCEHKTDASYSLPCRKCNTCRRIFEGSYTDIKILGRQGGKSTIGVDAVKDFKEDMFLTATESDYKLYIINDAEALTPQAQNALLTVMEEPPPGVVIFLLSSSTGKILTTIKSRAQYVAMERFSQRELEKHLLTKSAEATALKRADPEGFAAVIMKSDGYLGRAMREVDPEGALRVREDRAAVMRFVRALDGRSPFSELYSAVCALPDSRAELTLALEDILTALSDMIKLKSAKTPLHLTFFTSEKDAEETLRGLSQKRLFRIYELMLTAHGQITKNAMATAVLSSLAANIKLI